MNIQKESPKLICNLLMNQFFAKASNEKLAIVSFGIATSIISILGYSTLKVLSIRNKVSITELPNLLIQPTDEQRHQLHQLDSGEIAFKDIE